MDSSTDHKIQETIRRHFGDCTILTVAHRLETIIDFTKIAVLDKGVVVEYDSPHMLLQKEDGVFTGLVEELGEEAAANLKAIAAEASKGGGSGWMAMRRRRYQQRW